MAGPSDLVLQIRRKRENGTEVWEEGAHTPVAPRWQITIDSEMEGRNKMACRIANSAMLLDSTTSSQQSRPPGVNNICTGNVRNDVGTRVPKTSKASRSCYIITLTLTRPTRDDVELHTYPKTFSVSQMVLLMRCNPVQMFIEARQDPDVQYELEEIKAVIAFDREVAGSVASLTNGVHAHGGLTDLNNVLIAFGVVLIYSNQVWKKRAMLACSPFLEWCSQYLSFSETRLELFYEIPHRFFPYPLRAKGYMGVTFMVPLSRIFNHLQWKYYLLHRIFDGEEGIARIHDRPAAHVGLTHRASTEEDFAVTTAD
ncbi:hypothetical protein P692DRAFT_20863966 [Suillus brevipes Sb2]|nr:hypothetical protein P692DRAFT_20863966 [Suillus brevipes Sb2]